MKKITILSTPAGGGHTAVSKALQQYLHSQYNIYDVNTFSDVLGSIDVLKNISFSYASGEKLYNFFICRKWFLICNIIYKTGRWYFKLRNKKIEQLLRAFLVKEKTDLVISVVPVINSALINVAQDLQIPCFIIPTDLDSQAFIFNINQSVTKKVQINCAFDDTEILEQLTQVGFQMNQISVNGFPVRSDFFVQKSYTQIKTDFNVPEEKPVIMLLMGALGSKTVIDYVKQLSTLPTPTHLLICIGQMKQLKEKINTILLPSHITITIVGFTHRIADLMYIADLLISKSGTVSVCEAIYSNIPILLDGTSTILSWEQFNHTFIKKHGFGDTITSYKQIAARITELLVKKNELNQMKENMKLFDKRRPDHEIVKLVNRMLSEHEFDINT